MGIPNMVVQYSTALTCPALRFMFCLRYTSSSMPTMFVSSRRVVFFEILKQTSPFGSRCPLQAAIDVTLLSPEPVRYGTRTMSPPWSDYITTFSFTWSGVSRFGCAAPYELSL